MPPHALVPAAPTVQGTYAFPSEPTTFGVPAYVLHPVDAPLAPPPVTYQPSAAAERNRGIAIGALALLVFLLVMTAGSCVGFMAWADRQPRIPNAGRQGPAGGNDRVR